MSRVVRFNPDAHGSRRRSGGSNKLHQARNILGFDTL
jgi:hypothetical protein